jgi:hypothetical protein
MALGWKVMLPAALLNILITAAMIILVPHYKIPLALTEFAIVIAALFLMRRAVK